MYIMKQWNDRHVIFLHSGVFERGSFILRVERGIVSLSLVAEWWADMPLTCSCDKGSANLTQ